MPDENGNFRPNETITRGDFAFALHRILNEHLPYDFMIIKNFSDVSQEDSNYNAIIELANNGLINGFADNTFRPNDGLTRAQVCKLVDDAYNYLINKYTTEMKNAGGWATYQIEDTNFNNAIRDDSEGNMMIYTGGKTRPTNLYYNGEFVASADPFLETVREETVTTSDNKNWKIKWFGDNVVEIIEKDAQYIIKDNYSGLSKTYNNEYIPYEEIINALYYFTDSYYSIQNNGGNEYLVLEGHSKELIYDKKTIDGKLCCNISYIKTSVCNLYINLYWNGLDLETIKNKIKNTETSNEASSKIEVDIPDIPAESFASKVISNSREEAYIGDVISINKNTSKTIYEKKTRPVYYRLRELYSGKVAEQIIEDYNNNLSSKLNYKRQIPDGNLYCILFDIDLKDFYYVQEGKSFDYVSFITIPKINAFNLDYDDIGTVLVSVLPTETGKLSYYTGDLTQMFIVFETPKNTDLSKFYISFKSDDDSYKKIFVPVVFSM